MFKNLLSIFALPNGSTCKLSTHKTASAKPLLTGICLVCKDPENHLSEMNKEIRNRNSKGSIICWFGDSLKSL